MSVRTFLDHLLWKYIKKNPHFYGLYNRTLYSDAEQTIEAIGIRLHIVPRKEPPYLKFAHRTRGNHVFSSELPKILAMCALLRPGTLFVDAGANVGLWSASIARLAPLVKGFWRSRRIRIRLRGCRAPVPAMIGSNATMWRCPIGPARSI